MTFLFPALLGALGAVAAPVIIHLILRTRPRRVVFPALQFVRKTHQANISKLRLKHLILLALRMGAIALAVLLVARAILPNWRVVQDRSIPAAVVLVLDDSASMRYRHREKTLLGWAQQMARSAVEALPEGSEVIVLDTSGGGLDAGFLRRRDLVEQQLANIRPTLGAHPVGPAIAKGVGLLRESKLQRKELFVFTDMTRPAWAGGVTLPPDAPEDIEFRVIHCGGEENINVAMGPLRLGAVSAPPGKEVRIDTTIAAGGAGGEMSVDGEFAGAPIAPRMLTINPGGVEALPLSVRPPRQGPLHGTLVLHRNDPLDIDNVRYFTLHGGAGTEVVLVRDQATIGKRDDWTYKLIAAGLATEPDWIRSVTVTNERLDAERLGGAGAAVLCGVSSLSESQWTLLRDFARRGGQVLVVPGPLVSPTAYAQDAAREIVPAVLGAQEPLPSPQGWFAVDERHPLMDPFEEGRNAPPSDFQCRRRFGVDSLAPDSRALLKYGDGAPAVLERKLGAGRVVLWTCSPDPAFSDFARRPAFLILLLRTIELFSTGVSGPQGCLWKEAVVLPIPPGFETGAVTVRGPGDDSDRPVTTRTDRAATLLPDRIGHWTVRFSTEERTEEVGFSVNVDPAESDLTPVDAVEVARLFPAGRTFVGTDVASLERDERTVSESLDLSTPLLLGLLALLVGESFFANRFYKQVSR